MAHDAMRISTLRVVIGVLVIGFCTGSALIYISPIANAEALGTWNPTTNYPFGVLGESCVAYGGYIYCVGGDSNTTYAQSNSTYYATLSSSGAGTWNAGTNYPTNIYLPSCAASGGYIYCVGGLTAPGVVTNAVYYAPISSSGIGSWNAANTLPVGLEDPSCAIYGGYIYCVGGITRATSPYENTNATYYATISSSGVGSWSTTADYPTAVELSSCVTSGGYIYCVGGQYDPNQSGYDTNATYFATVSSTGLSSWARSSNYSFDVSSESCVASSQSYIYCVGGYPESLAGETAFYAPISSSGVGTWVSTSAYPTYVSVESCVFSGGYVSCVGGYTAAVYYALIGSTSSSSTTTSSITSSTSSSSSSSTFTQTTSQSSTIASSATTSTTSSATTFSSASSSSSVAGVHPNNSTLYIAVSAIVVIVVVSAVAGFYLRRRRTWTRTD